MDPNAASQVNALASDRGGGRRRGGRNKYRLQFAADSEAALKESRALAHVPIASASHTGCTGAKRRDDHVPPSTRVLSVESVRPPDMPQCSGPTRPPWKYDESVDELEAREQAHFQTWMESVSRDDVDAAFFEQNLETWRQLWRVLERSDVLVMVADIRYPALHFVPGLYERITKEMGKGMVLALNKCDLVSEDLLNAWKAYFQQRYPDLAIALFSSFPDAKLAPFEDANSELLSKRERRMARAHLAAWGADQLLDALETLDLSKSKRDYLSEWRSQMHDDDDSDQAPYAAPACDKLSDAAADCAASTDSDDSAGTSGDSLEDRFEYEDQTRDDMITIGVIGHPNAGKSTLINGIFGRKVVSTSSTPGHTKHLQTMFLAPHVRLCDCPGLVFPGRVPRALQVIAGMYPIAQLREPYGVVKYLADRVDVVSVLGLQDEVKRMEVENEEPFLDASGWTAWKICEAWACKRGFRTAKAARLDVYRAANSILRLALDGRIVLATTPPEFAVENLLPSPDNTTVAPTDTPTLVMLTRRAVETVHAIDVEAPATEELDSASDEGCSDAAGDCAHSIESNGTGNDECDVDSIESRENALAPSGGMFDVLGEVA